MKGFLKAVSQRWLLLLIALLLAAIVIWFGGRYVGLGPYRPLDGVVERCLGILLLFVVWALWVQIRRVHAHRASEQLAAQVTAQNGSQPGGGADVAQVRARFEEALAALKRRGRRGANLYELPWYIVIGPPGAGKTTAIASSGLNFPLAKQFGREALRGVGGTRNCDWWFTDEAILLDTAGRYTTQDSDTQSDQAGWRGFLQLLRTHRPRRPINGVIVAISATDLLSFTEHERRHHIDAVRKRLEELTGELRISVPVYVVLTKLDLLAGFTEFFDDMGHEARSQVWGATFDLQSSRSGAAASKLGEEFRRLLDRLAMRSVLRLESERDVQRRASIVTFPSQFSAIERPLTDFVMQVFAAAAPAGAIHLRGVYFTSATQEGTPIDRMINTLARSFGLSVRGVIPPPNQGRTYFVQRLLREVVFSESGLAGVNKRVEVRKAFLTGFAYVSICVSVASGLIALTMSYQRNRSYLVDVSAATERFTSLPTLRSDTPLDGRLDRLEALQHVRTVAQRHERTVPLVMRWGLYQGHSLTNAASDAYVHELNVGLLPEVAKHFRDRLAGTAAEADKLYEYLKAYLMFGMHERFDAEQLGTIGELEWQRVFADDPLKRDRLMTHYRTLLADVERVHPVQLDDAVVEQARNSLKQASLPVLMYSRLKLNYAGDRTSGIDVAREIGLGGDAVFVRKSGAPLSQLIPELYTRPVFTEISTAGRLQLVQQFLGEGWVLGEDVADAAKSPRLMSELMQLYEQDYIRTWDNFLADLSLRRPVDTQDAARLWGLLAAPTSPYKRLLSLVQSHTQLVDPSRKDPTQAARQDLTNRAGTLGKVLGAAISDTPPAGALITRHFESLHKLVAGSPSPIDLTLQKFGSVQSVVAETNVLGGPAPLQTAARLSAALKDLDMHAKSLPGPAATLVASATNGGAATATRTISDDFLGRYHQQVVAECQELTNGRYPLDRASTVDLPLADFSRLFGPAGTFDGFFTATLQPFVETNRGDWQWKPEATAIGGRNQLPMQFQRAARISQTYFGPGPAGPEVQFTVTPDLLDASAARLLLEIDGQTLDYRHGPPRAVAMKWPGPAPGQAAISVDERNGARPNIVERGSWSFFRLLERATVEVQSDTRFVLTFVLEGKPVRIVLQASSIRNPFARNLLQGFACQG